jgi:hypothetical protein
MAILLKSDAPTGSHVFVKVYDKNVFLHCEKIIGTDVYFEAPNSMSLDLLSKYQRDRAYSRGSDAEVKGFIVKQIVAEVDFSGQNLQEITIVKGIKPPEDPRPDLNDVEGEWSLL